jgi:molybdate transport system regulatory protein
MPAMPRYPGLTLRILGRRSPAMGPGRAELLEKIVESGSISAAAREMGMSYRRAWQLVEAINRSFTQQVVVTAIGGKRGGGTQITEFGMDVIKRFRAMESKASASVAADIERFDALLKSPRLKMAKPRAR